MIELTEELRQALQKQNGEPLCLVDPITKEEFVLLRAADYDRLTEDEYDSSPWTDEEMNLLAAEVDAMLDDDMAIEDTEP